MNTMPTRSDSAPAPMCHGRQMWAIQNRATNDLPYNSPIYWCPECRRYLPRVEHIEPTVGAS